MGWYWTQDKPVLKNMTADRKRESIEICIPSANLLCVCVIWRPYHSLFEPFTHQLQVVIRDFFIYLSMITFLHHNNKKIHFTYLCAFNLHVKAKAEVNYLNPFPIQVKACDHHSFCKVLLLLPVKRMNPFKCCYSYNSILYLPLFAKIHYSF